jgi:hypothetical protein
MLKMNPMTRFLIFAGLLFAGGLSAQHCPFDATGIIVVNIHCSSDTANITNLEVILMDSLGKVVGEFWRNPDKITYHGPIDCNHRADVTRMRFPFAKDNYVFVGAINLLNKPHTISIRDIDGKKNGGNFASVLVKLTKSEVYSLCGTYKMEVYPEEYHDQKVVYKPLEICLSTN